MSPPIGRVKSTTAARSDVIQKSESARSAAPVPTSPTAAVHRLSLCRWREWTDVHTDEIVASSWRSAPGALIGRDLWSRSRGFELSATLTGRVGRW
eukprot:574016-Prymnesium_polylepis.1